VTLGTALMSVWGQLAEADHAISLQGACSVGMAGSLQRASWLGTAGAVTGRRTTAEHVEATIAGRAILGG
jgi:hypothetical protein